MTLTLPSLTTVATVLLLLPSAAWSFTPLATTTSLTTATKGSRLGASPKKSDKDDDESLPFFLREDPPKAPDGATFFYNDAFKGMAATGNDMAAKAGELATNAASSVSDAVGKIDWDELQSNMQAFVKSTEVQKLKETSAALLKDVVSTVGDTAKAALAEKSTSASAVSAAQALLESKSDAVVVDAELEEIMKVAQEAAALTETLTTDDDNEATTTDNEKTA